MNEAIGLTFARVLRGVLRHDPNVILIGEIRDEETAEIAVRAAQVARPQARSSLGLSITT